MVAPVSEYTIHTSNTDHNLQFDHSREWRELSTALVAVFVNQVHGQWSNSIREYTLYTCNTGHILQSDHSREWKELSVALVVYLV